jgi:site-specific DNA recombinase
MEAKKDVGIWIRVSTDFQVRDESPEHHERRARLYAEAKGWNIIEVYKLDAVSGKSVMDHPEAKRMLKDIHSGLITGLIFSKLARLARNTKELLEFSEIFRKEGADLVSLAENIDTSSPAGRLFYTMIAAMAEWERAEIADRVAASVPIRAKMGKPLGGQASFGYKWDGKDYIIDEKEAPVRKLVYEVFLKHKRKKTTANELNKMGYRTRNGSEFSDTTIDRLLRDPSAKGERRANYTKSLGDGKMWELKPQSEWVVTSCPSIISEDIWNECNRILDEQEKKRAPRGPQAAHLFSGILTCSCGKKMYIFHANPVYVCKECKNRISDADITEIFHTQLKTFLLTETDITGYLTQSDGLIQEKETLLAMVNSEREEVERKMNEFIKMRVNHEMTPETFKGLFRPLEERKEQINDQLPELQAEIDFLKIQYLSADTVLHNARDLYERWPLFPDREKRQIIELVTDKITIGREDIHISLAYLPTSQNAGKSQHNFRDS